MSFRQSQLRARFVCTREEAEQIMKNTSHKATKMMIQNALISSEDPNDIFIVTTIFTYLNDHRTNIWTNGFIMRKKPFLFSANSTVEEVENNLKNEFYFTSNGMIPHLSLFLHGGVFRDLNYERKTKLIDLINPDDDEFVIRLECQGTNERYEQAKKEESEIKYVDLYQEGIDKIKGNIVNLEEEIAELRKNNNFDDKTRDEKTQALIELIKTKEIEMKEIEENKLFFEEISKQTAIA